MAVDRSALLAGPRGRRLCLAFALASAEHEEPQLGAQVRTATMYAAHDLDPGRGTSRVMFALGSDEPEPVQRWSPAGVARLLEDVPLAEPDERALLDALAAAVDFARYWQEPDGEDVLVALPEMRCALGRVSNHVAGARRTGWWGTPVDRVDQWSVTFLDGPSSPPPSGTVAERLRDWRAAAEHEEIEARRERPNDPAANWSGTWWSVPPSALTRTTRALGACGPVGLWLVEDGFGEGCASVRVTTVPRDTAVYEIDGPQAWAELCARYPLEVTASRRHDWYRTTGLDSRWVIPDWMRAADDFDGVHLTVAGYLTTAGRAVDVADGLRTVLAGWNPDETCWLTDVTRPRPTQQAWVRDDDRTWTLAPP